MVFNYLPAKLWFKHDAFKMDGLYLLAAVGLQCIRLMPKVEIRWRRLWFRWRSRVRHLLFRWRMPERIRQFGPSIRRSVGPSVRRSLGPSVRRQNEQMSETDLQASYRPEKLCIWSKIRQGIRFWRQKSSSSSKIDRNWRKTCFWHQNFFKF